MSDLGYAIRTLRRNPGFTTVAVLTLAIGIGAITAVFSLVDAVLLRQLPVRAPEELVLLSERVGANEIFPFSRPALDHLRGNTGALAGLAAFRPWRNLEMSADGEAQAVSGQMVSGNYYSVLGVRPFLGRTLTESDDRPGQAVAVIGHRFWQTRFGSDTSIVGRSIEVQRRTVTIVGVTPPEFFGTKPGEAIDVTMPLGAQTGPLASSRKARWLYLIGRRRPHVSLDAARAALRVSWAQLRASEPQAKQQTAATLEVESGAQGLNELRRQFSLPLRILTAAVAVVLLIACANVAGLLLVRSVSRRHEIGVRLALGARRSRLVRQFLVESLALALAGGALGVALAYAITDAVIAMMSRGRVPLLIDAAPDLRTLAFVAAISLLTVVIFGIVPAVRATAFAQHVVSGTRQVSAGRSRLLNVTVVSQIALLMLLLSGAALFGRTLRNLYHVDAGFQKSGVIMLNLQSGGRAVYQDLYGRLKVLPGVHSVTLSLDTPVAGGLSYGAGIAVPGRPPEDDDAPPVWHNHVGPRFFETLRIPLVAGRDFTEADNENAPQVVVIGESVAKRYFPGEDPLGKEVVLRDTTATIIGVARDAKFTTLRAPATQMVYRSYLQPKQSIGNLTFCIRTTGDVEAVMTMMPREVRAVVPDRPIFRVGTLDERVDAALVEERVLAALSGFFGVVAAVLACVGLYGTVAHSVVRRTPEIGIRIALGAPPGRIARMVLRQSFAFVAAGLLVGIPAALTAGYFASGMLANVLFELKPTDPLALVLAAAGVIVVAAFAAFVPARRASRVDPISALRAE